MRILLGLVLSTLVACGSEISDDGDDGEGGAGGGEEASCPTEAPYSDTDCEDDGLRCTYQEDADCGEEPDVRFECQDGTWTRIYGGFTEPQCTGGGPG